MLILSLLPGLALAGAPTRALSPRYEGNCQAPRWSPDGTKLAYEVNYHDRKAVELYLVPATGGEPRALSPAARGSSALTAGFSGAGQSQRVAHEASWGPASSGMLVYSGLNSAADYDLFLSTGGALAASPGADGGPAWSPNGRFVAFTSARSGQGDLYLLDMAASDQPPRAIATSPTASELDVAWSPGSAALAYVAHTRTGDNLFVVDDLGGATPRPLTGWTGSQTRPSWSPDGRFIAFYANHERDDRDDLYVVAASGGEPTLLLRGVLLNAHGPVWSPDSQRVFAVKDDDNSLDPVWAVPVASPGAGARLATGTVGNGDLDLARGLDGRLILAVAAQGMEGDEVKDFKRIFVITLD